MVTINQYRRGVEIANRGHVFDEGNGVFTVYRRDSGTAATVIVNNDSSGRTRYYSTGKYYRNTRNHDSYIAAVQAYLGKPMIVTMPE